jgi:hypothetical protein
VQDLAGSARDLDANVCHRPWLSNSGLSILLNARCACECLHFVGFLSSFIALFICRALPRRNLVQRAPLRFHPDVRVAGEHGARDVPRDTHDYLVTGSRLGEFGHLGVAVVVPAPDDLRLLADFRPRGP